MGKYYLVRDNAAISKEVDFFECHQNKYVVNMGLRSSTLSVGLFHLAGLWKITKNRTR
jgi:hypothetical protein